MSEQSSGAIGPVKGCLVPLSTEALELKKKKKKAIFPFVQGLMKRHSYVRLFAIPWTEACLAPLSMEFSMQEYWSGLPFPSPGDLPDLGIEPGSLEPRAVSLPTESLGKPNEEAATYNLFALQIAPKDLILISYMLKTM